MTTLTGDNNKTIRFNFHDIKYDVNDNTYIIELPTVICSDISDAHRIQEKVNTFVNELSRKLLKIK